MRILVISYEFPPVGGGGGHVARDICRELRRRGHEIHVLTSHYSGLPRQENQDGVFIERVPAIRRWLFRADMLTMGAFVLSGIWGGLRSLRAWRPDVIHVHFAVPSGPVAWIISRLSGIPYVLTAHLGDVPNGVPEKTAGWFRWIFPFTPPIWKDAAAAVAVSEHTRQLALQCYPVNVRVIPNGIELPAPASAAIHVNDPPRIIFAGRFVPQKNPLQIIHTLASLRDLPWQCNLIGDGPLLANIEQAIQDRGLQERIGLAGWVDPKHVVEHLSASDILFMPSISEGLSIIAIQALNAGLAIVASDIGGFIDLVSPGENGYLVRIDQPQGYEAALRRLLSDPARLRAFRLASQQKAPAFDIGNVTAEYEEIFQAVVESQE